MMLLLTPTEYSLWELGWKQLLNKLLQHHARDQARAIDQLAAEGAFVDPDQQAVNLPRHVLNDIKDAARKTLMQITGMNKPQLGFADIRQGSTELYMTFLDQLKLTIDKQVTED